MQMCYLVKKTFIWDFYITNKALPITKQINNIDSKKFIIVALDADSNIFVMYIAIQK